MGLFDKISNLIFEEEDKDSNKFEKKHWSDIFFEENNSEENKKNDKPNKKGRFLDIFFEEASDDSINSTLVDNDEKTLVLNDIASQVEQRESELTNLAEFFMNVNLKDYPDSVPECKAYLSLTEQIKKIKELLSINEESDIDSLSNYELNDDFRKFESDYQANINAIQSLCYLSEMSTLNSEMKELFNSNFTVQTGSKIEQMESYIKLISTKSDKFVKKYSVRLYKELIESEYRLTLLKLMNEVRNNRAPKKNPFDSFPAEEKKTFETYLSKDIRDTNVKYNIIADKEEKYIKYGSIEEGLFDLLNTNAEIISAKFNQYTIDNFLLNELLDNGDGYETLKRFLKFKLCLNFIDSKTAEVEDKLLDANYQEALSNSNTNNNSSNSKGSKKKKNKRNFNKRLTDDDYIQ